MLVAGRCDRSEDPSHLGAAMLCLLLFVVLTSGRVLTFQETGEVHTGTLNFAT
jgi:hypothetical protein